MSIAKSAFIAVAITVFSMTAYPSEADSFKKIKSEGDFNANIVGKTLTSGKTTLVIQPDGSITGSAPSGKVVGKWNWQKGYFCRALRVGKKDFPSDCQTVYFDGGEFYTVAQQGKGDKSPMFSAK
ncbi:hypothetical protein AB9K34_21125 [Sedimentitalea sp. XS_ASV28]|uniref:hypothetical protein n=1 Tax=Sedimentitalea sp. XS_ASV28 TaxID=3241296 RepID=UPI003514962D